MTNHASPAASPDGSDESRTVTFPEGLPGFPEHREFLLSDLTDDGTFQLLRDAAGDDLSLVVASPWLFFADYAPELSAEDERVLELERSEDALVFCSVTADDDDDRLYVNLLGPFVVNARTLVGRQVVLMNQDWPVRAALPTA